MKVFNGSHPHTRTSLVSSFSLTEKLAVKTCRQTATTSTAKPVS
jgi:hypothetical protein